MKANNLINSLLSSSQSLFESGTEVVKKNSEGKNLASFGTGALAGGLLATLLGTKSGRKLSKSALQVGSVAAVGALAYHAYKNHKNKQDNADTAPASATLNIPETLNESTFIEEGEHNSQVLLSALIAAAKSDGHIDENEKHLIEEHLKTLDNNNELQRFINQEVNKPLDPSEFAKYASDPALSSQIYLLSVMITNRSNFMEKAYLDELAKSLGLSAELVSQLEAEVL